MKAEIKFILEFKYAKRDFVKSMDKDEFFVLADQIGYKDCERIELDIDNDLLIGEDSFRFNRIKFEN